MKIFLGFLFSVCVTLIFAQPESPVIETIEGKKYYVHIAQDGNTLYGISKLYNTTPELILETNPAVATGVQVGQRILIPQAVATPPIETKLVDVKTTKHKVAKGDNLYNISKRYGVLMEEIIKLNPGCENGLALEQELLIPVKGNGTALPKLPATTQITFSDSIINYTVLPHETLYTISKRFMVPIEEIQALNKMKSSKLKKNEIIKIPVKKEKIVKVEVRKVEEIKEENIKDTELTFKSKNQYRIFYFLPFALDGGNDNLRDVAVEFLMGAQVALDSLERLGLNADVQVLDASLDSVEFKKLLVNKKVHKADVIIGPFMGPNVTIMADFARANKIRMVSPLSQSTLILKENPFVYNAVDSDITLIEGAASYLARHRTKEQIILVKVDNKDNELYQAFRQKFYASLSKDNPYKLVECQSSEISTFTKKGSDVILVVPSREKSFSTRFMNTLESTNGKLGANKITVFGTKDWANMEEIKGFYKNKYNVTFSSPFNFNYSLEPTKKLLKKYRVKYNADLSKYGAHGFDVTLYFLQKFLLNKEVSTGVMNEFNVEQVSKSSGFENKACIILEHENYELIPLEINGKKQVY